MDGGGIGSGEEGMQLTRSPRQLTQEAIEEAQEAILQEQNSQSADKGAFSFHDEILFMDPDLESSTNDNSHRNQVTLDDQNETQTENEPENQQQKQEQKDNQKDEKKDEEENEQNQEEDEAKVSDENASNYLNIVDETPSTSDMAIPLTEIAMDDADSYNMYINLISMNDFSRGSLNGENDLENPAQSEQPEPEQSIQQGESKNTEN